MQPEVKKRQSAVFVHVLHAAKHSTVVGEISGSDLWQSKPLHFLSECVKAYCEGHVAETHKG